MSRNTQQTDFHIAFGNLKRLQSYAYDTILTATNVNIVLRTLFTLPTVKNEFITTTFAECLIILNLWLDYKVYSTIINLALINCFYITSLRILTCAIISWEKVSIMATTVEWSNSISADLFTWTQSIISSTFIYVCVDLNNFYLHISRDHLFHLPSLQFCPINPLLHMHTP